MSNKAVTAGVRKCTNPSQLSAHSGTSLTSLSAYNEVVQTIIKNAKFEYIFQAITSGPVFPDSVQKDDIADECFLKVCNDDRFL